MSGAISGSPGGLSYNHRYKQLPIISRCLDGVDQALMIIWIATSVIAITPVAKWGMAPANHMSGCTGRHIRFGYNKLISQHISVWTAIQTGHFKAEASFLMGYDAANI